LESNKKRVEGKEDNRMIEGGLAAITVALMGILLNLFAMNKVLWKIEEHLKSIANPLEELTVNKEEDDD